MDAPALPRTVEDLAEWSVFADHLLTLGDPRGEALALELALSVTPTAEELSAFHATCPRVPRSDAQLQFGYRLGHVVVLAIASAHQPFTHTPEQGALGHATGLLSKPAFARLQQLDLPISAMTAELSRMLRRLPATCRRVALHLGNTTIPAVDTLIEVLPLHVQTVRLSRCTPEIAARFFTGRFAMVELERVSETFELDAALDAAPAVMARVLNAYEGLHSRARLGRLDSAGFLEPADSPVFAQDRALVFDPIARVIPRRTLLELQARFGVIPIRSQLAYALPDHQFTLFGDHAAASVELVHASGRWTGRSAEPFTVDDVVIEPKTVVGLEDGARVTIGSKTMELITHDLEARFRTRCSA